MSYTMTPAAFLSILLLFQAAPATPVAKKTTKKVQKGAQDVPALEERSKVCYVSLTPKVSCSSATTHKIGDKCSCKVGGQELEGRYLNPE